MSVAFGVDELTPQCPRMERPEWRRQRMVAPGGPSPTMHACPGYAFYNFYMMHTIGHVLTSFWSSSRAIAHQHDPLSARLRPPSHIVKQAHSPCFFLCLPSSSATSLSS